MGLGSMRWENIILDNVVHLVACEGEVDEGGRVGDLGVYCYYYLCGDGEEG